MINLHIRRSLSAKLSLSILLLAIPIFVLSLGILFVQSRNIIKKEAMEHAKSLLNTTMQRLDRNMMAVETATDIYDWEITENLQPDSLLALTRRVVTRNPHVDGCSISMEPDVFPQIGRYFSVYTVRETDTITSVIEQEYEYFEKIWYKTPHNLNKPCWVTYFDESDSLELTISGLIASYGKPIYSSDNQFIGVISSDISLIRLSKYITAEKPYPNSYFMMLGKEGHYFIHPDSTKLFTHTIFDDVDPSSSTPGATWLSSSTAHLVRCVTSPCTAPNGAWLSYVLRVTSLTIIMRWQISSHCSSHLDFC